MNPNNLNKIAAWRGGVHATLSLPSPVSAKITTKDTTYVLRRNRLPPDVQSQLLDSLSMSIIGQLGTGAILARLKTNQTSHVSQ